MVVKNLHGKIVSKKQGIYTNYVLITDSGSIEFFTQLPNWGVPLNIGDIGYFSIKEVKAGDYYINPDTKESVMIKYDNSYLQEFIKDTNTNTLIL